MTLRNTQIWLAIFMFSYVIAGVLLPFLTLLEENSRLFNAFAAGLMLASVFGFMTNSGRLVREMSGMRRRKELVTIRGWVIPVATISGLVFIGLSLNSEGWVKNTILAFCGLFFTCFVLRSLWTLMLKIDDSWSRALRRKLV